MSTAVALTASSIRVIKKESMIRMLQKKKLSNSFVSYLLSCIKKYQDHVAELLTSSAEQRLARVLLRLANLDRKGHSDSPTSQAKSPGSGGDGRHNPLANQFLHEPIPQAGIH